MAYALTTQHSLLLACALILLYVLLSSHLSCLNPSPISPTPHHFSLHAIPASSTPPPPPPDHVDVYSLFPPSSHPLSTTGELHYISATSSPPSSTSSPDFLSYPLCSFTNVCLTPSSVLFRFPNHTDYLAAKALIAECAQGKRRQGGHQFDLCQCFYPPELQPHVMEGEAVTDPPPDSPLLSSYLANQHRAGRPLRRDSGEAITPADGAVSNLDLRSSLPSSPSYYSPSPSVGEAIPGTSPPILTGHYWSVHKYVPRQHHIGHWAQRVVLFSSIFQHSPSLPLPPLDGLIIQDTEGPMTPHEEAMLNISLWSLLTQQDHPLLARYLGAVTPSSSLTSPSIAASSALPNQVIGMERLQGDPLGLGAATTGQVPHTCVERVSFLRAFGIFSTNNHDTMAYRAVAYAQYGIEGLSHRCPPRRVTLLTRGNRKILNQQLIVDWIQATFNKEVSVVEIDGSSTPQQQIEAFASSGLMLASHSSQLVNVVFSHPRSAMIEIAPEYYNSDFSEYAHGMGVFFRYAMGGRVEGGEVSESMKKCLGVLDECEGDSYCILLKRFEKVCKERVVCCKYMEGFYADMEKVQMAVQHAINHLNWACGEVW